MRSLWNVCDCTRAPFFSFFICLCMSKRNRETPMKAKASSYLNDPSRSMLASGGVNASDAPAHPPTAAASDGAKQHNQWRDKGKGARPC